jgi:hypothetical protein
MGVQPYIEHFHRIVRSAMLYADRRNYGQRRTRMVITGFAMMCYLTLLGALIVLVRWEAQRMMRNSVGWQVRRVNANTGKWADGEGDRGWHK